MHKILIIDDEETLLANIGDFLKARGYEVLISGNGKDGVEIIKSENPELLLLDLHLKEGPTGIQILRVAKTINPDLKVIVLTGFGEEEDARKECISLGASNFMSKPASLRELIEIIENLFKEA
ncbi:MAG: response regulator [Candidatus Omnitrophota bacterium]